MCLKFIGYFYKIWIAFELIRPLKYNTSYNKVNYRPHFRVLITGNCIHTYVCTYVCSVILATLILCTLKAILFY